MAGWEHEVTTALWDIRVAHMVLATFSPAYLASNPSAVEETEPGEYMEVAKAVSHAVICMSQTILNPYTKSWSLAGYLRG